MYKREEVRGKLSDRQQKLSIAWVNNALHVRRSRSTAKVIKFAIINRLKFAGD